MSFERTLQTHGTFQWPFVYCLIGLYWSHNPRFELRQSKLWFWITLIIKSRNFMSDAWFSMGWAAQVFWESVSSESPHRVDLLLTSGTAFSALPDLFTCFHQLTSFCQILSDFGVCVPSFFLLRFGNMQETSDIRATWRIEAKTIANVCCFWLLPMQWGLKILTALWDLIIQKHGNIAKLKESFLPHQSSRGRPWAVGWEPAFDDLMKVGRSALAGVGSCL